MAPTPRDRDNARSCRGQWTQGTRILVRPTGSA